VQEVASSILASPPLLFCTTSHTALLFACSSLPPFCVASCLVVWRAACPYFEREATGTSKTKKLSRTIQTGSLQKIKPTSIDRSQCSPRRDSNPQSLPPEGSALSIRPQGRVGRKRGRKNEPHSCSRFARGGEGTLPLTVTKEMGTACCRFYRDLNPDYKDQNLGC
jgi:hypothetical protein